METVTSYVVNRSLANILTLRSNSTKGRKVSNPHCVKSVRIRSYSSPYFPSFGLNTERSVSPHSVRMQRNTDQNNSEYGHYLCNAVLVIDVIIFDKYRSNR